MSDSVRPHSRQPTRLPHPWDSPGKNTGGGCHFLLQCMKVKGKLLSHVRLLAIPWTAAYQAPPSIGFSRLHLDISNLLNLNSSYLLVCYPEPLFLYSVICVSILISCLSLQVPVFLWISNYFSVVIRMTAMLFPGFCILGGSRTPIR